ncbi:VC0807 family protein, partial [Oleiphilus sp. HI0043]|uniref:VC0807 family protein n=4 Tax=Oleiphilus TaxID=141450 RepID=UPI000A89B612
MSENTIDTSTQPKKPAQKQQTSHLLLELAICVILPTVILKYLSGDDSLGPVYALIFGLSFPLLFGIYQFIKERKFGFIPALGFISILLTSGIGLLELDAKYIAIKEASIPLIIAIGTIVSLKTKYPLVKTFIYNDKIL